ncbi:hypothetical protein Tco_1534454 [Tanacetum coccineum]
MVAIFHDMIEITMEVFMDDFSSCLSHLDKMHQRCEDTNLVQNWEKCHFMVKEGIVLGHKISKTGIEVDKAKVDVIAKLPHPTTEKGIRSFLGHAGFYRRFIRDFSKIARVLVKMAPKQTTRSTPVTPTPNATTTTTVTKAQLQALIDQGVAVAMAEAEASRVRNGYDSNGSRPRLAQAVRECSYSEFLKCKPLDFKGTEETMILHGGMPITPEAAHAMSWATLKKMMTDKYCPRGEIKKIKTEMMFPEEVDKIEKYIGGLPDMILGSVKASKLKTMQEVIEFTTELMEDKTHAYAKRQAERKRKYDDLPQNNQN